MRISANNPLADKLVTLSGNDLGELQAAIAKASNGSRVADLKMVVEYLSQRRKQSQEFSMEQLQSSWKIVDRLAELLVGNTGKDNIKDSTKTWLELEIAAAIRDAVHAARSETIKECAKVADYPGFVEARDSDFDIGFNAAKTEIGKRIRAL